MTTNSKFFAGLAGLFLIATPMANPSNVQTQIMDKHLIIVSGVGEVKVDPDQAEITIGVQYQSSDAKSAQQKVNVTATAVRDAVLKIVQDRKNLQTSRLSLHPQYGEKGRITGYSASNLITIVVPDIDRVGDVVDATTSVGATNIHGISFGIKDSRAAEAEALKAAVADARFKADAIASALGHPIVEVLGVSEGNTGYQPSIQRFGIITDSKSVAPVEAGQVDVEASVTVRFRFSN